MEFELHPNLIEKVFIQDLPLCRVLMENEKNYPWIFLVPRRPLLSRIMDLSSIDQLQFMKELQLAQEILWDIFQPTQLNVAAIGNKTSQLHMHVIARYAHDPAWPGTVWDHPIRNKYTDNQQVIIVQKLKDQFCTKIPYRINVCILYQLFFIILFNIL